ncbi:MAG: hypothetical protein IPO67_01815 [Deltaproteobacteria bacterium]|nr:hypothetical protein [Deltaproteobacteria bacterium]
MSLSPRQLCHRGAGLASALWLRGPDTVARALAQLTPGASLHRLRDGLLVRWPKPSRVVVNEAPGVVLTLHNEVLWAFPPTPAEREALRPARGAVVLCVGGVAEVVTELEAAIDPLSLITAQVSTIPLRGLGAPPAPPLALVSASAPRERFGVAEADPAAEETRAALMALAGGGRGAKPAEEARGGWLTALVGTLGRWWRGRREAGPSGSSEMAQGRAPSAPAAPAGASWWERLLSRLDELALQNTLRGLMGARHARFLGDLMEELEGGDLEKALRAAIPLSEKPGEPSDPRRFPLRLPQGREQLKVTPGPSGGGGIGLQTELFARLRQLYTQAAERLTREGRIEEAAFVYAELLDRPSDAVGLLEKHGRFALAADIAETRRLSPAWQIALRLQAGETERAMDLARRFSLFEEAALRLVAADPKLARSLRLTHITLLAGQGRLGQALGLAIQYGSPRMTVALAEQCVARGGLPLVTVLALIPNMPSALIGQALHAARPLLRAPNADPAREALLRALARFHPTVLPPPERHLLQSLQREAARVSLRAAAEGLADGAGFALDLAKSSDPALYRELSAARPLDPPLRPTTNVLRRAADDRGAMPIHDLGRREDGAVVLALGETGLVLLQPDGARRPIEAPAWRVILGAGDDALALAPRGEVSRVSRVNLHTGAVNLWGELRIQRAIRTLQDGLWWVALDDGLALLDPHNPTPKALWRSGPIGAVSGLAVGGEGLFALVEDAGQLERWRWSTPELVLRDRDSLGERAWPLSLVAVSGQGRVVELYVPPHADLLAYRVSSLHGRTAPSWREEPARPLPSPGPWTILWARLHGPWLLAALEGPSGLLFLAWDTDHVGTPLQVFLDGAAALSVSTFTHNTQTTFVLGDDLGRALWLSPTGQVLGEWRS